MTRPANWNTDAVTRGVLVALADELDVALIDVPAAAAMLTRCWDDGTPDHLAVDLALETGALDPRRALATSARLQPVWVALFDQHSATEKASA